MDNPDLMPLHVKLSHQVPFGKAVYMVGDCASLGNWHVDPRCRLNFTDYNYWRKVLFVPRNTRIEYKYVLGDFEGVTEGNLEWELGSNRVIDAQFTDVPEGYLDQKWNILKVRIDLLTELSQNIEETYVVGNCVDLGLKISKRTLNKGKGKKNASDFQLWSLTFSLEKHKAVVNYYYFAKRDDLCEKVREPGRYFHTDPNNKNNTLDREAVEYRPGEIRLVEHESFRGFRISKLNECIFIGPYVKKREDLEVLKENGVKAILNLQSNEDMARYRVDFQFIRELAHEYEIFAYNFQIADMNFKEFINKASQALKLLRKLVCVFGRVYVHCTAGVFRSPQLAILYLVKFEGYKLSEALQLMKAKRPYCHPYLECLQWASQQIGDGVDPIENALPLTDWFK